MLIPACCPLHPVYQKVPMPITTILLDLDDTILQDDPATDSALLATAQMAEKRRSIDPARLVSELKNESRAIWQKNPLLDWCNDIGTGQLEGLRAKFLGDHPNWQTMRNWGPGFRRSSWINALANMGIDDLQLADDLNARFEMMRNVTNPWCDGAEAALAWLAERYQLGMITNGIPDVQRIKIDQTGIANYFDDIIISGELGFGKPDPRIFETALNNLNAKAGETLMVGDNLRRDALGPTDLGIRGVWLTMNRELPQGAATPWLSIDSLKDLPNLLI